MRRVSSSSACSSTFLYGHGGNWDWAVVYLVGRPVALLQNRHPRSLVKFRSQSILLFNINRPVWRCRTGTRCLLERRHCGGGGGKVSMVCRMVCSISRMEPEATRSVRRSEDENRLGRV